MVFAAFHKVSIWISRQKGEQAPRAPTEAEAVLPANWRLFLNLPDIDWDRGTARGRAADCMVTNIRERVNEVIEHAPWNSDKGTRVMVGNAERQQKTSQDWRKENWDAMRAELRRVDKQSSIR
jgi:hypothetical protein